MSSISFASQRVPSFLRGASYAPFAADRKAIYQTLHSMLTQSAESEHLSQAHSPHGSATSEAPSRQSHTSHSSSSSTSSGLLLTVPEDLLHMLLSSLGAVHLAALSEVSRQLASASFGLRQLQRAAAAAAAEARRRQRVAAAERRTRERAWGHGVAAPNGLRITFDVGRHAALGHSPPYEHVEVWPIEAYEQHAKRHRLRRPTGQLAWLQLCESNVCTCHAPYSEARGPCAAHAADGTAHALLTYFLVPPANPVPAGPASSKTRSGGEY